MFPSLAIGPLTNLQDARSCAAVGFDYVVFSLARGSHRMIPASSIWSIANWLSGPGLVLELNGASLPELEGLQGSLAIAAVVMPAEDWVQLSPEERMQLSGRIQGKEIWLACQHPGDLDLVEEAVSLAAQQKLEARLLMDADILPPGLEETYSIILHFSTPEASLEFIETSHWQPAGIWLGPEMEEAFGQLDYDRIDAWLETWTVRFSDK